MASKKKEMPRQLKDICEDLWNLTDSRVRIQQKTIEHAINQIRGRVEKNKALISAHNKDNFGRTDLALALVEDIVNWGADADIQSSKNETPLRIASEAHAQSIVNFLHNFKVKRETTTTPNISLSQLNNNNNNNTNASPIQSPSNDNLPSLDIPVMTQPPPLSRINSVSSFTSDSRYEESLEMNLDMFPTQSLTNETTNTLNESHENNGNHTSLNNNTKKKNQDKTPPVSKRPKRKASDIVETNSQETKNVPALPPSKKAFKNPTPSKKKPRQINEIKEIIPVWVFQQIVDHDNLQKFWPTDVLYTGRCKNKSIFPKIIFKQATDTSDWAEIKANTLHGFGLYAKREIPAGTCFQYAGRFVEKRNNPSDIPTKTCVQFDERVAIVTTDCGNETRFINLSSVAANCLLIRHKSANSAFVKVTATIKPGQELLMDPGTPLPPDRLLSNSNDSLSESSESQSDYPQTQEQARLPSLDEVLEVDTLGTSLQKGRYFGALVAVKTLMGDKLHEAEISKLKKLHHPNLIQTMEIGLYHQQPVVVMEHLTLGDLKSYLEQYRQNIDPHVWEPFTWKIAVDVASALSYLHSQNFTHGDIEPRNVFLFNSIDNIGKFTAKLGGHNVPLHERQAKSVEWAPPEHATEQWSHKADVYSYGLVLLFLSVPWPTAETIHPVKKALRQAKLGKARREAVQQLLHQCNAKWREVISPCVETDPHKRPEIRDVYKSLQKL